MTDSNRRPFRCKRNALPTELITLLFLFIDMYNNLNSLLFLNLPLGHHQTEWNPNMAQFIYGKKNEFYLIDLTATFFYLKKALSVIKTIATNEGKILFVSPDYNYTLRTHIINFYAKKMNQPSITAHWMCGLLTNWKQMFQSMLKLLLLKKEKTLRIQIVFAKVFFFSLRRKEQEKDQLFYKEHLKEIRKYWRFLIFCMYFQKLKRIPPIMFLINPDNDTSPSSEYQKLNRPIVSITDTNSSVEQCTYPIPANDDSLLTCIFFCNAILQTYSAARIQFLSKFRSPTKKKYKRKQ